MDILINVVLPLSLAIIMFSLGNGLEFNDFKRVATRKYAFLIGAFSQVVVLPVATFAVVILFDLPPEIAAGFMLLSFCPGGVTSNILSKLAKGDVALSVTLTSIISLLSILTVPFLATWAVTYFMKDDAPYVSVLGLGMAMFLITTIPVLAGVSLRHWARPVSLFIERGVSTLSLILFVLIVVAALAGNWAVFVENLGVMGDALVTLTAGLLLLGLGLGRLARLNWAETKTISLETGIQNSTLGITLAALISGTSDGFSALALPSAVYGITMYIVALPFILGFRMRKEAI